MSHIWLLYRIRIRSIGVIIWTPIKICSINVISRNCICFKQIWSPKGLNAVQRGIYNHTVNDVGDINYLSHHYCLGGNSDLWKLNIFMYCIGALSIKKGLDYYTSPSDSSKVVHNVTLALCERKNSRFWQKSTTTQHMRYFVFHKSCS